jgi:hypothetical protein
VRDALTSDPIEGAHIIARNEELVAVTDVAVSDAQGSYRLELPTVRDADGKPLNFAYTLRGAAMQYEVFPGGLRTALPIFGSEAVEKDQAWVIEGALTELVLLPLEDQETSRYRVSGSVNVEGKAAGVLVVAKARPEGEPQDKPEAWSAISDRQGNFTLFNVASGQHDVRGYAAGLQLVPAQIAVFGQDVSGVSLTESDAALVTVSGSVQIVSAPGNSVTSVIMVLEDTFDEDLARGEAPLGCARPSRDHPPSRAASPLRGHQRP